MSKFSFYGLLGNNCGVVSPYTGSSKRLQEIGFTVDNGIPTLRGFAKISLVLPFSTIDPKYITPILSEICLTTDNEVTLKVWQFEG